MRFQRLFDKWIFASTLVGPRLLMFCYRLLSTDVALQATSLTCNVTTRHPQTSLPSPDGRRVPLALLLVAVLSNERYLGSPIERVT